MTLFDATLGRRPGKRLISGEESDVLRRICRAGGFGIWLADTAVAHWIVEQRQSVRYLRRYYEGRAFMQARKALGQQSQPEKSTASSWRGLLRSELNYFRGRLFRQPELWVKELRKASELRGTLKALREVRRESNLPLKVEA